MVSRPKARPGRGPAPSAEPNWRHIKAFVAVAECGSISRAARTLGRAQSAVTRSVIELEGEVGATLFERRAAGMELTLYGRMLLRRAARAGQEFAAAAREIAELGLPGAHPAAPVFHLQVGGRRLAALVTMTELQHMPDAAQALGVSQPAVSAAIREIENGLGVRLFERTPRGMLPTGAALILARRAKLARAEIVHAMEEMASLRGVTRGHVRVGVLALSRTAVVLPRAIARLMRDHPAVTVSVMEGAFHTQELALRSGDLDFVVGALREFPADSDLDVEPLFEDRLSVVVRPQHPLAARGRLRLRDLAGWKWILNRAGTPGRDRLEEMFRVQALAPPDVAVQTGSLAMTRALLLESDCLTALSAQQVEPDIRAGLLAMLPVALAETVRTIGIIRRKGGIFSPAATHLAAELRKVVADAARAPDGRRRPA